MLTVLAENIWQNVALLILGTICSRILEEPLYKVKNLFKSRFYSVSFNTR